MNYNPLKLLIISLFEKGKPLPQKEIMKLIDMDKSKLSGYLQAMADYGDLSLEKYGTSYVYSRKARGKK